MREILFRGKPVEKEHELRKGHYAHTDSDWVYGYFVNCASIYDDPEKDRVAEIIKIDADRIYDGEYSPLAC